MKKLLLGIFILFLGLPFISAQDQLGRFSLAGNINYGTNIESLGVGLRSQYGFTDYLRGSLEYKYYIDRHNVSAWGITVDAHYVFGISNSVSLYPIAGVTVSRWTTDYRRSGIDGIDGKFSQNRLGCNLGFAGQLALSSNTFVQIEAKEALIKDHTQFVVSVGFMYQF